MAEFHPLDWAQEHPYATGGIVFVGGLAILWMLGYIGGGSKGDGGTANLAAAFYAAEAQQAVAGTQLNIAETQANAAVRVQQIQGDAAVSINAANAKASTDIAANMYASQTTLGLAGYTAGTTQAAYAADVSKTGIVYNAQTAQVQSHDAVQTAATAAAYNYATAKAGYDAAEMTAYIDNILPQELAQYGTAGFNTQIGSRQFATTINASPSMARAVGYSEAQIAQMWPPG